jgi:DNA-binding beta-propeller fold protein YncE
MTLGKPGGSLTECCFQPNDVIVAPDGSIFVSQGHNDAGGPQVVWKFDKDGHPIKPFGTFGHGRGEFDQPHSMAFDAAGRLYVADRNNNRIQIFDQNGYLLDIWYQFSRPSGIFIDKHDILYSADSESQAVSRNHLGWRNGIRIGSVKDGKVIAFIPDPANPPMGTSAAEGVAADDAGNIYGAEVGPRALKKYVKK